MYAINTLKGLNERAFIAHQNKHLAHPGVETETETNRRCSFHESRQGLVLHSAKQRDTKYLGSPKDIKAFKLAYCSTNSLDRRDAIIESYWA